MKQKRPSIGIVVCARERNRIFTSLPYIQSVADHGGMPFSIPYFEDYPPSFFRECEKKFDGFLFCGGGDINPLLFRELPSGHLGDTDFSFDLFQLRFMTDLLEHSRKPTLAICKGMQILSIACQGSIYQDLSENPTFFNHSYPSRYRSEPAHTIRTEEGSMIREILGETARVNSFHHQGVKTAGSGLICSSYAPDGMPESIEGTSHPFLLGVQWHPECMYLSSKKMSRIFSFFLGSC
ncbi:hypothetical protein B5F37_00475 [Drancourtella sp. An210]|nr:hypothetical protein B5F37_00475 [Drancourtella sp. An210]OUP66430.1 hypothetical protein B5F13_04420 [Drancourtella sp. An177]